MAKRRKYDREFKLDILRQVEQKPPAEVCREYDLHPSTVNRWKTEQRQYPKDAFKGKGNRYKLEAEVAQYQRLVGQLYAEITLLKKAIANLQERQAEEKMLRPIK